MKYTVEIKVERTTLNTYEVEASSPDEAEAKALDLQNCANPEPDNSEVLKEGFWVYDIQTTDETRSTT